MSATDRLVARLGRTIPALPVRDIRTAALFYRDRFSFDVAHEASDFAVVVREEAVLHLWSASDDAWRASQDLVRHPVCSGAESFLAGTASCRIEVGEVDALFAELRATRVVHETSLGGVKSTDFGTREFHTVDCDGNLLTFFRSDAT